MQPTRATGVKHRGGILEKFASRKLNLGCGFDVREGYINVDLQQFHNPDLIGDITNLSMLPSLSIEEIIAQDVLEHFRWRDTARALYEWNRLLKAGGRLFIRTTYLNGLLRKFESPDFTTIPLQKLLIVNLFSMQEYEGDYHLTGFTERLMRFYLWAGGFEIENIRVRDEWLFEIWARKVVDYSFESLVDEILDDADFVDACYENILRRPADQRGKQTYSTLLAEKKTTREDLIKAFLVSPEMQDRLAIEAPSFELLFHEARRA